MDVVVAVVVDKECWEVTLNLLNLGLRAHFAVVVVAAPVVVVGAAFAVVVVTTTTFLWLDE